MTRIKKLEMADNVICNQHICVERSLFGLSTRYYYQPTHSKLKGKIINYSTAMGEKLINMLRMPREKMMQEIAVCGEIVNCPIGHWQLELCRSLDGEFVALQLFRFVDFQVCAATDIMIFYGREAQLINGIIN